MFNLHYCFFHLLPHLVAHLLYSQSGMQSRRLILWGEILFCFNEKTNKGILFQKNPAVGAEAAIPYNLGFPDLQNYLPSQSIYFHVRADYFKLFSTN